MRKEGEEKQAGHIFNEVYESQIIEKTVEENNLKGKNNGPRVNKVFCICRKPYKKENV